MGRPGADCGRDDGDSAQRLAGRDPDDADRVERLADSGPRAADRDLTLVDHDLDGAGSSQ